MRIRPSAFLVNKGKVLTLKYTYSGGVIFNLPGGNLEFGEELKEALARELVEEVGVQTNIGELLAIAETFYQQTNTVHFVFRCEGFDEKPILNPKETSAEEIVWLPIKDLEHFTLYPNIGKFLDLSSPAFLGVIDQPRY